MEYLPASCHAFHIKVDVNIKDSSTISVIMAEMRNGYRTNDSFFCFHCAPPRLLPGRPVSVHEGVVDYYRTRTAHQPGLLVVMATEAQVTRNAAANGAVLDQLPKHCNVL
jgi:hypothetical protein